MLYLLLFILFIIYMVVLLFDKDIFSPSAIICESYIFAVICASLNIELWRMSLSVETFKIILIGVLAFVIPSLIILHTCIKTNSKTDEKRTNLNGFSINEKIYVFFIILQFITIIFYLYYVVKTVGGIGEIFNLSNIMQDYRQGTSYGDLESQVPTFVNQLVKVSQIIGYISLYYFIYTKIVLKKNNDLKVFNIISIILYIFLTLLSGGRYKMISFFIAAIVMWFMLKAKMKNEKINFLNMFKVLAVVAIVLFVFSKTRTLVGRNSDADFISYISTYFGGSIQSLNLYLDDIHIQSDIFGKETFYAINNTLAKFGIIEQYRMHLEFRSSNGVSVGNVYTAFRCFYQDFGYYGVVVLQVLLGTIWTIWYKKIKKQKNIYTFDSGLLFYCMFVNCLFFSSYRDNFFSSTLSIATLTIILYFMCIKKVLIKEKTTTEIKKEER